MDQMLLVLVMERSLLRDPVPNPTVMERFKDVQIVNSVDRCRDRRTFINVAKAAQSLGAIECDLLLDLG